jgi:SAM-dependent methyltransferase
MTKADEAGKPRFAVRWEDVPCPLCGARRERVVFPRLRSPEGIDSRLVRCDGCGLGYLNPRPDRDSIRQFYTEDYDPYRAPSPSQTRSALLARLEQRYLALFHGYPAPRSAWWESAAAILLAPWLAPAPDSVTRLPFHGRGRLLDVGCGSGWFGHRMRERGWDVTGIDFNPHAVRQARNTYGYPVHLGTLPHSEITPRSFDVVTMGCVLEHVHDPHELVAAAREALCPGGYVAVTVPNFNSWTLRTFGQHSHQLDAPRHLLHFTPETLRGLLRRHGLEVTEQRMLGRSSWLRRTVNTVCGSSEVSGKLRGLARLMKWRLLRGLLTKRGVRRGESDAFLMLAYRPSTAGLPRSTEETRIEGEWKQFREGETAAELVQVP